MRFTDLFIRRPVLAVVVNLLILLVGVRSYQVLQVRQYPETSVAVVTVATAYPGADADLVQSFVTSPLEREIASADGIDYLVSTSSKGVSTITAHLVLDYDTNDALSQITSKVNKVRNELPEASEDPTIDVTVGEGSSSMYMALLSDEVPQNRITDYVLRVLQPKLESVAGVQSARVIGERVIAMRAWLDPDRMAGLGVTGGDVRQALLSQNALATVGRTRGSMVSVDLSAATDLHDAEEFRHLVIRRAPGATIRLEDVADVELGAESYDTSAWFDGQNATFIGIDVLPTANVLTVIRDVRALLPEIRAALPPGLRLEIPYDATVYIESSISEVMTTLVEAVLIVVVVIFLFLGSMRAVAIPVVAIPLSLVGAGFCMLVLGYSVNLLTLLALVLAIGLVVDDAIIVVENVHRHVEEGMTPREAAITGARELAGPVIAMTITLVAVYLPIGFIGGLTGSLFTEFAFTLAGAVLVSGVVALTLSPVMSARVLKGSGTDGRLARFLDAAFERLRAAYTAVLGKALDLAWLVAILGAGVLVSCFYLYRVSPKELAPAEDQGLIFMLATAQPNASIDQTELFAAELSKVILGIPETAGLFQLNGIGGPTGLVSPDTAAAGMVLEPWNERERTEMELIPAVQGAVGEVAGMRVVAFGRPPLPGAGRGLPFQLVVGTTSPPAELLEVSSELLGAAWQSGLFAYADLDLNIDRAAAELEIDRDLASDLGVDMRTVGVELGTLLAGGRVNRFSLAGRSYEVIPQLRREARLNPEQLGRIHVRTASGELVPLDTFAHVERRVEPRFLARFQQLNSATVSGVLAPGVPMGDAVEHLKQVAAERFPPGYSIDYSGQTRQYVNESGTLVFTFFFALVVIYLVLAAQFDSFRDPLIMLVTVPMSVAGALVFLAAGYATINIYTQVGLVTLIGLISKHGILIVEFANELVERHGRSVREAAEEAAGIRLRPVLMTTGSTVLGVIPLLIATGAGASARFSIGLVIAAGISIGTLFTLFVVPVVYLLVARGEHRGEDAAHDPAPSPVNA